jgi:exodeoxyribonuclease V beta subunit
VFELVDFVDLSSEALADLVATQLDAFGLSRRADETTLEALRSEATLLVRETVRTPLLPETNATPAPSDSGATPLPTDGELRLDRVPLCRRLNELEFHLPVTRSLDPKALGAVFAAHPSEALPADYADRVTRLGFRALSGFLKGVIDLLFEHDGRYYVADYKTNHLGDFAEDYHAAALSAEMAHANYVLQYHLYALAAHRYLRRTVRGYDYDQHFGGALYLFVKGMRPGAPPGSGIFFERPPLARMDALGRAFGEEDAWR